MNQYDKCPFCGEKLEITYSQLALLKKIEGGGSNSFRICKGLGLSNITVFKKSRLLEEKGYLKRKRGYSDKGKVEMKLILTPKAKSLMRKVK